MTHSSEPYTVDYFNNFAPTCFPASMGMKVERVTENELEISMPVTSRHLAPNGFLHGGAVVALADTCAGYAALANLPEGSESFATLELKTNFLSTARSGNISGIARAIHLGRSSQVWDVDVINLENSKTIAVFRCTQTILYKK